MKNLLIILIFSSTFYGQNFADLKLKPEELPKGYTFTNELNCKSIQVCDFYNSNTMYNAIVGKVKNKTIQSFDEKSDEGVIMYFEYENNFGGEEFLKGLLWGQSAKPTKEHPEEYFVNNNILIIWSFKPKSELKKISQEKIKSYFAKS
jgi:hypothetical protein